MRYVYHLIVLYLTIHLTIALRRERRFWKGAAIVLVLVLFGLRLFLIR